jgi:hypothetical protein
MKKFIVFLLFFLFVGTVGCRVAHYLIVGVELSPAEVFTFDSGGKTYYRYRPATEFKDKIIFRVTKETLRHLTDKIPESESQCYAASIGKVEENTLLLETFSITIDRDFSYGDGDIIEADVDLLQFPAFVEEIAIIEPKAAHGSYYIIEFSDTFSRKALFDSEPYTVTFSCRTSDDLLLQADATVKFPAE